MGRVPAALLSAVTLGLQTIVCRKPLRQREFLRIVLAMLINIIFDRRYTVQDLPCVLRSRRINIVSSSTFLGRRIADVPAEADKKCEDCDIQRSYHDPFPPVLIICIFDYLHRIP
jgi:hypothetical protein